MTSNLAQTEIGDQAELLRKNDQKFDNFKFNEKKSEALKNDLSSEVTFSKTFIENTIEPILKSHFKRDEFLGRINEILYFLPFNEHELKQLTEKELFKWKDIAKNRHSIDIQWDDDTNK